MTEGPGVLRILRARVRPGLEEAWLHLAQDQIARHLATTDGVLTWHIGRPTEEASHELVIVSTWRDIDALRAFAGASGHATPFKDPNHLAEETTVEQYELV